MKPNAAKNQKLIGQYPFIKTVLDQWLEPYAVWDMKAVHKAANNLKGAATRIDNLAIKIEKADGDLMFRQADNIGIGDNSCIFQMSENRKGQVMRRGEYVFAIGEDDNILNFLRWPRNKEEGRHVEQERYAKFVLWGTRHSNGLYSNPLWDKTKCMVWVTVETWHEDTKNDDVPGGRFGPCIERSFYLTIYGKPKSGFQKLDEDANVYQNLRLTSTMLTRGALDKNHDLISISGMLYEMCIWFQDEVYFNGMKDILDNGKYRGASGQFGSVKVLCAEMCGYDRVQLEDSSSWISFQLRPGSKNMYVLGQDGTLPQIRNLVKTVIKLWSPDSNLHGSVDGFKPDSQVSVI